MKRRESQVHGTNRERSAEYRKFRTHVLKIGRYLIDASDTKRFPAGLLNTCPKGANSQCSRQDCDVDPSCTCEHDVVY